MRKTIKKKLLFTLSIHLRSINLFYFYFVFKRAPSADDFVRSGEEANIYQKITAPAPRTSQHPIRITAS